MVMALYDEYDLIFAEIYAAAPTDKVTAASAALDAFEGENLRGDASLYVWVKAYAAAIASGADSNQAGVAASNAVLDHAATMASRFDRRE